MSRLIRPVLFAIITCLVPAAGQAQSSDDGLARSFPWRNIGPATMMGRISAIDAWAEDYRVVLIGSASGGVFKSVNGGISVTPIFEEYGSQSIGDVALFQGDTSIIWVGTGEATNRNSVGWGDGIYKSTDGGKTFAHMGLRDTYQISEIATHPTNPDIVYAAAIGSLWGSSGSRGLYKTTDGGATWTRLTNGLPGDGRTGATVVTLHPDDPNTVFVGMYERLREPHTMTSGGPNGGIYKSSDAGQSFRKLTRGLPTGETGQIDLSIFPPDPNNIWAYVEASDELPDDPGIPGPGVYQSRDGGETWTFRFRHNSRPYYHGRIRVNPADPQRIYVVARDFYHSADGGETWVRGRPWGRGGGDDHDLWIDPKTGTTWYMATDQGAYLTVDNGATTLSMNQMAIGQYYAIGVDMRDPYWVYGGLQDNGGWGIPSNSRDPQGILNDHATETNGGDGFHMQVDPTDWRTLYTTAHVGYFGRVNVETWDAVFITPTPTTTVNFADYYDPDFPEEQTNYSINPEEAWLWRNIPNRTVNGNILPPQFRFNWNAPLVLSPTNPHTLYVGSNYLFRSVDRGETWRIVSPDLTKNDPRTRNSTSSGGLTKDATGAENHNTIYTVDESALDPGIIWVGTDDGNVQVTRDGGATWTNVRNRIPNLPAEIWTSRVEASKHAIGRAYVTFDGHWVDDYRPYVYRTEDYGRTWTDISANLPREIPGTTIYTIVEDDENADLLFIGTEFGVYVTVDRGRSWERFRTDLPTVAVHDLVIHPRDRDLVAGTHGRSIWIADDISPLQQLTPAVLAADAHLFTSRVATRWISHSKGRVQNYLKFRGANPPRGATVDFHLRRAPSQPVEVAITDPVSGRTRSLESRARAGINRVRWNLEFLPTAEEIATHRAELTRIHAAISERLRAFRTEAVLAGMRKDLLATQRTPNLYPDAEYPNRTDARVLLLDHLRHIGARLDGATTVREFAAVRDQLLAYSHVVGDDAYFGFYGEELRNIEAPAGTYIVTLTVDGQPYEGQLRVREDPLLNRP